MVPGPAVCEGCRCAAATAQDALPNGPATGPATGPAAAILAHGQPGDPGALQPEIEALAAQVQALLPGWRIHGATLACKRSLAALHGVRLVYPHFMADGWFVRSETPRRLALAGINGVRLTAPLGLDPGLPALGAVVARETASAAGIDPATATLVVVGHGSGKSRAPALVTREFAKALAPAAGFAAVTVGFIEEPPFLADVLPEGPAVCLPFFATGGEHVTDDIPQGWRGQGPIAPPIGTTAGVAALIAATLRAAMATEASQG